MYCKLCTKYPADETDLLDLYSTEAKKLQILEIIQKHLSILEIDPNVHHTYTICSNCCRILCNFHELYLIVGSALKGATIRETDPPEVLCQEFKLEDDILKLDDCINAESPQPAPKNPNKRPSEHLNAQNIHTQHEVSLQLENEIVVNDEITTEAAVEALNIANDDDFEQRMALDSGEYENEYLSGESACSIVQKSITHKGKRSTCKTESRKSPTSVLEKYVQSLKFEGIENSDEFFKCSSDEFFKCSICNKVASDGLGLKDHMQTHKEKPERTFQCEICSKRYFRRAILRRHLQVHVPDEEKKAKCPKCEKSFPTTYIMKEHLKNIHLNAYSKVCETCGKSIKGREAFRLHQQEHAGGPKVPKHVTCEICGLELTKYALSRHMKIVHSEKNAECELCGLKFTKDGLSRHNESVHSEKQICTICSKVSPTVRSHREHMKYVHNLERKHACPMCDKAFKTTKDRRVHIATHTGAALCKCPYCPKTYNSSSAMYSHRRKMHLKEMEANATTM